MAKTAAQIVDEVERLVDASSLSTVLEALSNVAGYKAEHIRCNWQDRVLARAWEKASQKIAAVSLPEAV
jgi:hypothetical protein